MHEPHRRGITAAMTDRLYEDPALARFYDLTNGWSADFDFCAALAEGSGSVLDLGCGTGELATALASGRRVVGVDLAEAMLMHAQARPGGGRSGSRATPAPCAWASASTSWC